LINLKINGEEISVKEGTTVLEATFHPYAIKKI